MSEPKQSNQRVRGLAHRLLAHEAARKRAARAELSSLVLVAEAMRAHLITVIGNAGFRSLLARALTLARKQVPALDSVRIETDGSLSLGGFRELAVADENAEGSVILIAEFLGLLVTFIGESLTLTLLRNAWPDLPAAIGGNMEKSDDDPTR